MPGEFVAYGYARWVRTWIDHPRYVPSALFTVDLAPIRIDEMPAYAFGSEAERRRVAALLADYNRPAPDADPDEDGRLPPGGMTPAIDAGFDRLARERIAAHPLRYYLLLPARRAFSLWFDTHADFYPFAGYLLPVSGWNREEAQQVWLPIFAVLMAAWTVAGWAARGGSAGTPIRACGWCSRCCSSSRGSRCSPRSKTPSPVHRGVLSARLSTRGDSCRPASLRRFTAPRSRSRRTSAFASREVTIRCQRPLLHRRAAVRILRWP